MKLISILLVLATLAWTDCKPIDIASMLEGIAENERSQFLKTHIKIGHDLSRTLDSEAGLSESEEFSLNLYNLVKNNYSIQDEYKLEILSNIICFDDGICIDIGDIGVHPKALSKTHQM